MNPYRPIQRGLPNGGARYYLGPIYTLDDSTRLRDTTRRCRDCGKRLAEVHHDPAGVWRPGSLACLDCGRTTR